MLLVLKLKKTNIPKIIQKARRMMKMMTRWRRLRKRGKYRRLQWKRIKYVDTVHRFSHQPISNGDIIRMFPYP